MTAYAIFLDEVVNDPASMDEYRKNIMATLEPFQGKFIIRRGNTTVHEGAFPYERVAVIAFPSRTEAEGWYNSPAYQRIIPFRTQSIAAIIDGLE